MDAVVFDFDGLILDTETALYATTATVFDDHGLRLDATWWATEILGTAEHPHWTEILAERLGRPLDDVEALTTARNLRYHETLAVEAVRPGVVELLTAAADHGVPCAVASSSPRDWVEGHLERLGIDGWFAAVRTRDDVEPGRTKPAPDLFLAACDAVEAEPARSVALEDSPNGVAAARAAGMRVVGVAAGLTVAVPLDGADLVVGSLAEVTIEELAGLARPPAP
jgi:HAD superfamily hydrolase (TIGR01509 family)